MDDDDYESKETPPEPIYKFRKLREQDPCMIPEKYSNRKRTDVCFLFFLFFFLVGYIVCVIVCAQGAKPLFLKHGYDKCGNICGMENEAVDGVKCSGQNLTHKPQMTLKYGERSPYKLEVGECAEDCPEGKGFLSSRKICYVYTPSTREKARAKAEINFWEKLGKELKRNWPLMVLQALLGLALTAGVFALVVLKPQQVLRPLFIMGLICQLLLMAFFIYKAVITPFIDCGDDLCGSYYTMHAVSMGMIFILGVYFCLYFQYEFEMSLRLIEEAIIIFRHVPQTLTQPLITFVFEMLVIVAVILVAVMLFTCKITGLVIFTHLYNLFVCIWLTILANHCEYMILAGTFSPYYFTRDRSTVKRPLCTSYAIVCTFHLGTLILGSMIIAIIRFIKNLLERAIESPWLRCFVSCLLQCCEDMLNYIAARTYIVTFLHGQPFCKSAKRALRLLFTNLLLTVGIDIVASTILVNLVLSLFVITLGIGFIIGIWVESGLFPVIVLFSGILVLFIAASICSIFNTAITTIFICFCEDQMLNDGKTRPYYMPKHIAELFEEANIYQAEKKRRQSNCC